MKRLNGFLIVVNGTAISIADFEKTILQPTFSVSTTTELLKDIKYAAYVFCSENDQGSLDKQQKQQQAPTVYKKNDAYIEFFSFVANDVCVIYVVGYGKISKRKKIKFH